MVHLLSRQSRQFRPSRSSECVPHTVRDDSRPLNERRRFGPRLAHTSSGRRAQHNAASPPQEKNMSTLKQILAELTAFGNLANFGRRAAQLFGVALAAPQRLSSSGFRMNKRALRYLLTLASIL